MDLNMSEEDIARCFQIEDFRAHPDLWVVTKDGRNFICDGRHAALWYCQGWNNSLTNGYRPTGLNNHPAALRAYQMGWDDADPKIGQLELPSVL